MAAIAIGLTASVITSELAKHTARLQDAENENAAMDALVPAYDADMTAIAAAARSGTPASECIQAAMIVDNNCYNYLRAQVGKTGTFWTAPPAGSGPDCNKQCTTGCCNYYAVFNAGVYGLPIYANGTVGMIPVLKGSGGQASTGHPNGVYVPEVYPPSDKSYGNFERAAYWLDCTPPPPGVSKAAQVLNASGSGVGLVITPAPAPATVSGSLSTGNSPVSASGLLGALTNNDLIAILGVVGGLILIITAFFGQNALRVDQ
jgi:hypothetical protein